MAVTQNSYTGNNSRTVYDFTFPYLKQTEIKATLDGTATTAFSHPSATSIQFNTAPGTGVKIKIFRETDSDSLPATFYAGSALKSEDLNDNFTQNLYATQEVTERYLSNLGGTMTGDLQLGEDVVVKFEGASDNAHETTLTVADPTADRTITLPNVTGTVVTTGDTGTVATGMIANDAINGTKIADDAVDSEHIAADSLDTEHYAPASVDTTALGTNSVTTAKITALNVTTAKIANLAVGTNQIAADAINGGKIADDSIDSEHYVDGSIDTAHIGDDQVTAAKLANTSVTAGTYSATDLTVDAQGRITAASSGTIARSEIAADAIDGTKLADNAVNSEHYTDGSIDHVHLANDVIDGDNIQDDVINSEHYAAGSIDTEHIADSQVTRVKIAADAIDGTKIADNAIGSEHVAANSIGDSEIATGALDNRYYTETESDARYFNVSTGDTIKDGDAFPDNDTTIATTAAINDRIIDLVDDVGGFVPIANETSFPNANPDVNNGTGTIVSIGSLAGNLTSNGSGVITISNGTVGNSTVTITGAANSTTYLAGYGMLLETTTTLNTYTFHRLSSKATEVTTVAGSISNVNTVAGSISNVNAVAGNASNINTVAADAADIGAVAGKATEIGRLGTADAVSDLNTLGTTAIVSDLDTLADISSNITTVAGISGNVTTVAGISSNVTTVAGVQANVTTVAGSISNVNTVATNISNVNDFSDKYRVASSAPGSNNDAGDLYFDTSSNELRVYNGSSWQGGVTATGNLAGLGANTFTGHQSLGDSLKVQLGASQDLQIYHNGTDSYIKDTGTGCLVINTDCFRVKNAAHNENLIAADENGNVQLFYDSSKKLETTSGGGSLTGDWNVSNDFFWFDNGEAVFGSGGDLKVYHDGTNNQIVSSNGDVVIQSPGSNWVYLKVAGGEQAVTARANQGVELYYDNAKKLQTQSGGVRVFGDLENHDHDFIGKDNCRFAAGNSEDLQLFHDGSNSYLKAISGGTGNLYIFADGKTIYLRPKSGEDGIKVIPDGAVELYYNDNLKLATNNDGITLDNNAAQSTVYLKSSGTTRGYIFAGGGNEVGFKTASNEWGVQVDSDAEVALYYDGSKKFATKSSGVDFFGDTFMPDGESAHYGTSNDMYMGHSGSYSYIEDTSADLRIHSNSIKLQSFTGGEKYLVAARNGAVELYYDDSKKFETTSGGVQVHGQIQHNDGVIARYGNSGDLQIYHDGNSHVSDRGGSGDLWLETNGTISIKQNDGSAYMAQFTVGGACSLRHNNSTKLATTSGGIDVTGTVTATSFSGSGANLTNLPAGGNTFTATAQGDINHLKAVQIRSDGKVEQISETGQEITPQASGGGGMVTTSSQLADDFNSPTCVWDPDADKNSSGLGSLMVYWAKGSGGNQKYPQVSTVHSSANGLSWTYNDVQEQVDSGGTEGYGGMTACYDTNANKHVVVFRNNSNSQQLTAKVGTYNSSNYKVEFGGSLQNFGSQNSNNHTPKAVFEPGTNKVVVVFRAGWNGSTCMGIVGTVSGNSISWGSPVGISGGSSIGEQCCDVCLADSGKVLVVWRETDGSGLYANLCTISSSSNTMTVGSSTQINNTSINVGFKVAYSPTSDYGIVAYIRSNDLYCRRISVSGSSLSISGESALAKSNSHATQLDVTWLKEIDKIGCHWIDQDESNKPQFQLITNSSGTPTWNTAFDVEGASYGNIWKNCVVGSGVKERLALGHKARHNQNRGKFAIIKYVDSVSNRVEHHYVGFADQNVSSGGTAKILTYGNVKNGFSGLTAGTFYYTDGTGTLGTSSETRLDASNSINYSRTLCGMAISDSKLLIREPMAQQTVQEY